VVTLLIIIISNWTWTQKCLERVEIKNLDHSLAVIVECQPELVKKFEAGEIFLFSVLNIKLCKIEMDNG